MPSLKDKIEFRLKELKRTEYSLIEKIGVSKPGYYKMLRNDTVKIATLEKIADELDVPVSYFFSERDRKYKLSDQYSVTNDQRQEYSADKVDTIIRKQNVLDKKMDQMLEQVSTLVRHKTK